MPLPINKLYTFLLMKSWFLYVLKCENGLFYIGISLYPEERIDNHFCGNGANFTKKNKPIEVIELYSLNEIDREIAYKEETRITRVYREKYGIDKVVGGKKLRLGK
jgi:predicted GIY-YIG superfamily endonuclease